MKTPVRPIFVAHLIPEVRNELLIVLESLTDEQWNAPTVCTGWSVRDVAGHILGDDVGLISRLRDNDNAYYEFESLADLLAFIDAQNDVWVRATRRMSRKLLIDQLREMGEQVHAVFLAMDPHAMGGPIGWAGDDPDPLWLHIARELTEYWTHHQHICEAVGRTSLKEKRYLKPVLGAFAHALPPAFRDVDASPDTLVKVVIPDIGTWHVVREPETWALYADTDLHPASTVTMDADTAWRLFTKNRAIASSEVVIEGNTHLGENVLRAVGMLV